MSNTQINIPLTRTQHVTLFDRSNPLVMEIGERLFPVTVAYETYGDLSADGKNAILVCHALTGSAHAAGYSSNDPATVGWWDAFIGPGKPLDTNKYFVICSNFLGGYYGTTGSSSTDLKTGAPYGLSFPQMTVRDMVTVQKALIDYLGVKKLRTVIGGSLGGMQTLEWGIMFPSLVDSLIPIATASRHSAWCIGLNALGRQAILNDPEWRNGRYYEFGQPENGLSLARQIAMVSYRSEREFDQRFGRERHQTEEFGSPSRFHPENNFQVERYLQHQGTKLVKRFDANTYIYITRAMDLHDVSAGRGDLADVLHSIPVPTLNIGIDSDILYPVREQREMSKNIPHSTYSEISSPYGHDAFLIEYEQMGSIVRAFLS